MTKTILIVDDEVLLRKALSRAFLRHGNHHVLEASNGQEGYDMWMANQPDVILIDVIMPHLTGPQVIKMIPESLKKNKIIYLMSAYTANQAFENDLTQIHFLHKPFENVLALPQLILETSK